MLEDDPLDTGEELPINALPELTKQDDKKPNQRTPRQLIETSARVFGFVLGLLPPGCTEGMPAPRHAASHPTTVCA